MWDTICYSTRFCDLSTTLHFHGECATNHTFCRCINKCTPHKWPQVTCSSFPKLSYTLKGKQSEDMRMIKLNEMHNFKDPQNRVWDNASLETCGARGKLLCRLGHIQKPRMKLRKHKNCKLQKVAKIKVLGYVLTYDFIEVSWLVRSKFTDCITIV